MTAYMCSDEILKLLALARIYEVGPNAVQRARSGLAARRLQPWPTVELILKSLWDTNLKSIPIHDRPVRVDRACPKVITLDDLSKVSGYLADPMAVIACVEYYQFQSCCWDQWESSPGAQNADSALWSAIRAMDRYQPDSCGLLDGVPWG